MHILSLQSWTDTWIQNRDLGSTPVFTQLVPGQGFCKISPVRGVSLVYSAAVLLFHFIVYLFIYLLRFYWFSYLSFMVYFYLFIVIIIIEFLNIQYFHYDRYMYAYLNDNVVVIIVINMLILSESVITNIVMIFLI